MTDIQFAVIVGLGIGIGVQLIFIQFYLKDILAALQKERSS